MAFSLGAGRGSIETHALVPGIDRTRYVDDALEGPVGDGLPVHRKNPVGKGSGIELQRRSPRAAEPRQAAAINAPGEVDARGIAIYEKMTA